MVLYAAEAQLWQATIPIVRFWNMRVFKSWRKFSMGRKRFRLYVGAARTRWLYSQALAVMYDE